MSEVFFNPMLTPILKSPQQTITEKENTTPNKPFSEVFDEALGSQGVEFSKHAVSRLEERGISLDEGDINKLSSAVDKASDKGVRDSLILLNGLAFIVSVKDRKVVTAMQASEANGNVFTNIDGAVIA